MAGWGVVKLGRIGRFKILAIVLSFNFLTSVGK